MSYQNGAAHPGDKPITNSDNSPHSQTLDHVTSYPLVSDLLDFYSHNSLGAKSIEAFNSLYASIVTPLLPYLKTPISIASPYLHRADELGDNALNSVDSHFPAVKSTDYNKLRSQTHDVAAYPFKIAQDGRDYIVRVYQDERKKVGGEGVVALGKTVISAELHVLGDAVEVGRSLFGEAKQEAKKMNGKAQ
ncbi:MAG: hypothetical protein Q9162_005989 [Coniocarpon cinnabarinum]